MKREFQEKLRSLQVAVVHFYGEITEKEIYQIIQEELQDLQSFCVHIERVLKNPPDFKLLLG